MIRLPLDDTKPNYLSGFWTWISLMAADDYAGAVAALLWDRQPRWSAETLRERVTTFFGGDEPWSVVVPNERLIHVVDDAAEWAPPHSERPGYLLAQIPLTTRPDDPLADDIPLMGLAASFFVRSHEGAHVLELEIFHV
jgi:hypothetical protein